MALKEGTSVFFFTFYIGKVEPKKEDYYKDYYAKRSAFIRKVSESRNRKGCAAG